MIIAMFLIGAVAVTAGLVGWGLCRIAADQQLALDELEARVDVIGQVLIDLTKGTIINEKAIRIVSRFIN